MKKLSFAFLIFAMVLSLAACSININIGDKDPSSKPEESSSAVSISETTSSEAAESGFEVSGNLSGTSESSTEASSESSSASSSNSSSGKTSSNSSSSQAPTFDRTKALPEDMKDSSYKALIKDIEETKSAFGEAFIGRIEGPMGTGYKDFFEDQGYMDTYPFLAKISYDRYIETSGNEMYCIVPKNRDCNVKVTEYQYSQKTGFGKEGKVLYESDYGDPIIITCNKNPSAPNTKVTLSYKNGKTYSFSPVLDQYNEWLSVYETPEASAYDFSVYGGNMKQSILRFDDVLGDWSGFYYPGNGKEIVYHFKFYEAAYGERCVEFWYGETGKQTYEYYEGYANEQYNKAGEFTGYINIDMYLTRGTASATYGYDEFIGVFQLNSIPGEKDKLIVTVTTDERLMRNYDLSWFECESVMG